MEMQLLKIHRSTQTWMAGFTLWSLHPSQSNHRFYMLWWHLIRLRWAGHVIHHDDDDLSRRVLLSELGGKRPRGRPRLRWENGVEEDVARLGCRNWKNSRPKPGRMEESLEGGRGPPRTVAPLEREREREHLQDEFQEIILIQRAFKHFAMCNYFFLSASQPTVGLYSQPFSGNLASSFEVSRSNTTTRHSR